MDIKIDVLELISKLHSRILLIDSFILSSTMLLSLSIFISSEQPGSLAIGDIVGSNIFDIFILAVCLLVCVVVFIKKSANQTNNLTLIFTGVGTIFILLALIANQYIPCLI